MHPIKFSENTMTVLKNFSTINGGLFFTKGHVLRTMNGGKSVLAEATIDEEIPQDFGISELNQLLSILSLHKETPSLTLVGNNLVVEGNKGRSKITYRTCDKSSIKTPPVNNISMPNIDVSFLLTEADLSWIMRSTGVLASPNIAVIGDGKCLYLRAIDAQDNSSHTDTLEVAPHTGAPFNYLFKIENWTLIPGTYEVEVSAQEGKGVAHFTHQARKIQYWIAMESKTK